MQNIKISLVNAELPCKSASCKDKAISLSLFCWEHTPDKAQYIENLKKFLKGRAFVNVEEDITYVQRIVNRIKKIVEKSEITKYVKYSYFRHQLSVTNIMVFFSINPRYISYFKNLQ